jgi:LacI family transcriptional regulator
MTIPADQNSPLSARKRVRMQDVAARAGVSISTVSLVLSGDTRIPEDTARKVLQTVKAMEYRPNVIARSLARRGSRTIGVILPEFAFEKNQPFYFQALQGIHAQTQPAGFKILIEATNRVFLERRYYLRLLKEQSADGIIYMAASLSDSFLEGMVQEPYPFVLLGAQADDVNLPTFTSDNLLGAQMAVKHLVALGHKKIGHVAGDQTSSIGRERTKGYSQAMKEATLPVDPSWIVEGGSEAKQAETTVESLVRSKVTAIFAGNDVMAYGVLKGLAALKVRVPQDIAVMGMDDLDLSASMTPSLSTVRYDITQLANQAAKFVLKNLPTAVALKSDVGEMPAPQLVIRESCGAKK